MNDIMKGGFILTLVLALSMVLVGCELDTGENFHFEALEVTEAAVPESFTLNRTHVIQVEFLRGDDCTYFEGFDVFEESGGVLNIVAIGSVLTNEDCTAVNDTLSSALSVIASFDGLYRLRFYAGETEDGTRDYLEYEVPVVATDL